MRRKAECAASLSHLRSCVALILNKRMSDKMSTESAAQLNGFISSRAYRILNEGIIEIEICHLYRRTYIRVDGIVIKHCNSIFSTQLC